MRAITLLLLILLPAGLHCQFNPPGAPPFSYNWQTGDDLCDYLFLGMLRFGPGDPYNSTNLILDRKGDVLWYFQATENMFDFKVHPSGHLSFYIQGEYIVLDSNFAIETGFVCRNGRRTDQHDILIREDKHVFMVCFEDSTVDLSNMYTSGGLPGSSTATLAATLIQEMDWDRNVLKEWRAFPHFDLNDVDTTFFTAPNFLELNHTNSLELAPDGTLLLSHRHNHEVTAIDWNSGEILWRLGGTRNQFALPNDIGLSAQHDARLIGPNRVSVFDNGEFHDPPRARGVVYDLDTVNMIATRTQEWYAPGYLSKGMGSFQVLPNGDALLNYGRFDPFTAENVRYFRSDSTEVLSIDFANHHYTYRARCQELPFAVERPEITCTPTGPSVQLSVAGSPSSVVWSTGEMTPSITVTDTGRYQVFVPLGIGMVGSEVFPITDLGAPCAAVSATEAVSEQGHPARLTGRYDLLGRPVPETETGRITILRYDNGQCRKVIRW
ncbi:MAG: arylsulfotransferase family protein [Bacteroidota bacterium]